MSYHCSIFEIIIVNPKTKAWIMVFCCGLRRHHIVYWGAIWIFRAIKTSYRPYRHVWTIWAIKSTVRAFGLWSALHGLQNDCKSKSSYQALKNRCENQHNELLAHILRYQIEIQKNLKCLIKQKSVDGGIRLYDQADDFDFWLLD